MSGTLVKQMKQTRGAVGIQRCTDGLCRCDICGSRHFHQQRWGTRRNAEQGDELPLRVPSGRGGSSLRNKRPDLSGDIGRRVHHTTTRCSRAPGVHRRGSDHRRPCSMHCQSTVVAPGPSRSSPLPTMVRTASHNGENLSESDARAVRGRLDLFQPCTEERESVHVEYVWMDG